MPIVYNQLTPANALQAGYADAKELARQTVALYGQVRFAGVGIAAGSCCAAVAMQANPPNGFPVARAVTGFGLPPFAGAFPVPNYGAALAYAVVAGNSQLAQQGLVWEIVGGHAERAALTAVPGALYTPPGANQAVLFVELMPCNGCQNWLNGGGGGVANPFNGVINGVGATTLNVWWRWPYPDGVGVTDMNAFHAAPLPAQLADINANW